ncbi:hypothetical protein [Luteimonas fraxinea]|uniref:Uncharacterized protein n=1 Tax=Luteimonas fraxinea TaxID=2901869 RepID=A0ABS8UCP8_9GAMM|nr:hypothetical protein [Luteimonas fraxinea]MCD9096665.1 hypothetical protein [Luteimonas fraxinea]MCD9126035.1 hypothetical protein [Luteimonas fraxinea]
MNPSEFSSHLPPMPAMPTLSSKRKSAPKAVSRKRGAPAELPKVVQPRLKPVDAKAIAALTDQLLLGPGDDPKRKSYFDFDDSQDAGMVRGRNVHMILPRNVTLPDYRKRDDGLRQHRTMVTIPPKLRANVAALFGFDDVALAGSEVAMTTAIVVLADYAAAHLKAEKKLLVVGAPHDPLAAERKQARMALRNRGRVKNGKVY